MNRESFLQKPVHLQIKYINQELTKGISLTKTCRTIGISKSICEKFKAKGYVLIDKQYTLQESLAEPPDKLTTSGNTKLPLTIKPSYTSTLAPPIRQENAKVEPHTISMNSELWKRLKVYGAINNKTISEILSTLATNFLIDVDNKV